MIDKELLAKEAKSFGVSLSSATVDILDSFSVYVSEQNKLFNLTAITEGREFTEKHLIDSLSAVQFIPENSTLCDIGAGAGFPSFPIAAVRRDVNVTALDSTSKKTSFVLRAANAFGISNLSVLTARAEECVHERESFDIVTARAVAPLGILSEIALPLVKAGGLFIAYKTDPDEPVSLSALDLLGGSLPEKFVYSLPSGDRRCLFVFRKTKRTDADFPRQFGKIKKSPLF